MHILFLILGLQEEKKVRFYFSEFTEETQLLEVRRFA